MIAIRPMRLALLLAVVPLLAGCGFRPVYMPTASGTAGVAQRELAAVNVALIYGRPGQLFRQALQEQLASDNGVQPSYELQANFWITGEGISVQPSNIATRVRLTGNVSWILYAKDAAHTQLTSGSGHQIDGANLLDQQYFAFDLENEAVQRRLAAALAQQVSNQLAIYFRNHADTPG